MQHSDNFDDQSNTNVTEANSHEPSVDSQEQSSNNLENQQPQMLLAETNEQADVLKADIENHLVLEVPVIEILSDDSTATEDQNEVTANAEAVSEENGFAKLGLSHALLKSLSDSGYTVPTPIQAQAIPPAMAGRDLLLSAQTGSGKTAAFVLPILDLIAQSQSKSRAVRALILTPTRELAQQVSDSIRRYGSHMRDLYCIPLVGGAPYTGQIRALKKGVQIIIATPGRLLDHMSDGRIDLTNLSVLVLDEADRMLDMGFSDDINRILQNTPTERQTIMSSATWAGAVGKIAESFTKNPERIAIKVESAHIDEKVYFCDDFSHKNKLLESLVCDKDLQQAIIFTATKRSSEQVAERLQDQGHKACFLHGDLPQSKRNRILADVKAGKYDIIVATDVAARGIDVPAISHVFNYDLPRQVEDYVHRIGRCGRAGRTGIAINLCSRDDRSQFSQINRYLKREMTEATVEGLEPRFIEKNYESRGAGRGRSNSNSRSGGGRSGGYSNNSSNGGRSGDSRNDSRGSSRPSSSYAGNRDSSPRDSSSRDGASRPSFSRGDSRPSDNRGSSDRSGGERRSYSSSNGSSSNAGGYRGERSDSRPSNASSNGQNNNGKMLTSHEFNFSDKLGAGRGDRPERNDRNDRNDRGDRPQFDRNRNDRGDRPQQGRSEGGRSEGGRSQYAKPAFGGDRSSDRQSDSRSNDRGFDRSSDRNSDRRSAPRDDRSGRPSFDRASDRPMSKNSQGYEDRKRQSGSSDRPQHDGERRSSGFGRPEGGRPQHSGSGESFARRPRQDEGSDSRRDGDKPARRQSSFAGRSDRRDSTGKPV